MNYIKRLVGLPGEKLRIVGGDVYTRTSESTVGHRSQATSQNSCNEADRFRHRFSNRLNWLQRVGQVSGKAGNPKVEPRLHGA